MPEIYHFCEDEKFINSGYAQFEELYPEQNHFYIYNLNESIPKHIHLNSRFTIIDNLKKTIEELPEKSIIIFHSLPQNIIEHLKFLPKKAITVGLFFGFEVYNDPFLYSENKALSPLTKLYFADKSLTFKKKLKEKIWPIYRIVKKDLYLTQRERKINALRRLDYFGTSFKEEHVMIQKLLGLKRPVFNFWYYPLEKILETDAPINLNKSKVMIGNSGFKTNNHLDVFKRLSELKIKNKEIFSPVSYGDQKYISAIREKALIPGNTFAFMEDFMSLQDYQNVLDDVQVAILNTRRQQAVGNIIALIYAGAKVFISERSTFFHYLKRNKIKVFSYEKDLLSHHFDTAFSPKEIEYNRTILTKIFSSETLKKELKKSVEEVFSDLKKK